MKKLLFLMLALGGIFQLDVTGLCASSQAPTGTTIANQLAVVQSAYNQYMNNYNGLYTQDFLK